MAQTWMVDNACPTKVSQLKWIPCTGLLGHQTEDEVMAPREQAEVFISYASQDRERVIAIAGHLEAAGVTVWLDQQRILGGDIYGPAIVRALRTAKVMVLMCTDAAMRSPNVRQEIVLAWKYQVPYLPLLLEPVSFPEQLEYWLEGWQWTEVLERPVAAWRPAVLQALAWAGVSSAVGSGAVVAPPALARPAEKGLAGLLAAAQFTDQFWPLPVESGAARGQARTVLRDLGAPQDGVRRRFRVGERVRLALESERAGYLLVLDWGASGTVYCLCPSWFAPDQRLAAGCGYLPQVGSRYDAFTVTGQPGREQVLAIISDEPLGLDWLPPAAQQRQTPARVLTEADIEDVRRRLQSLEADRWVALATYFEVIP